MHDAHRRMATRPPCTLRVGLIVKTWADLMLEVVSEVALRNPDFRKSLPAGFARPDFDRSQAQAHFSGLVDSLSRDADLDASFDMFVDNFIRSRTPDTAGTIAGFQTPDQAGLTFRLKPNLPWRFAEDGEDVVIITTGGEVRFPAAAEAGLHVLLDGGDISAATFTGMDESAAKDTVRRLYAYGLIEPV